MRWPRIVDNAPEVKAAKARVRFYFVALLLGFVCLAAALGPSAVGVYRLAFPPDTDAAWDSKVGWRLCNGAIAAWPDKAAPNCDRLRMCDNEGGLTDAETARLKQMMAAADCRD
jgi:hypothetical protein